MARRGQFANAVKMVMHANKQQKSMIRGDEMRIQEYEDDGGGNEGVTARMIEGRSLGDTETEENRGNEMQSI